MPSLFERYGVGISNIHIERFKTMELHFQARYHDKGATKSHQPTSGPNSDKTESVKLKTTADVEAAEAEAARVKAESHAVELLSPTALVEQVNCLPRLWKW